MFFLVDVTLRGLYALDCSAILLTISCGLLESCFTVACGMAVPMLKL